MKIFPPIEYWRKSCYDGRYETSKKVNLYDVVSKMPKHLTCQGEYGYKEASLKDVMIKMTCLPEEALNNTNCTRNDACNNIHQ